MVIAITQKCGRGAIALEPLRSGKEGPTNVERIVELPSGIHVMV